MQAAKQQEIVCGIVLCLALAGILSPGILAGQVPAFRDGFHFYYPQSIWLTEQQAMGNWFPSWNPNEGLGVAVAGQPSAAIYYPLRIVFSLPFSVPQNLAIYCLIHLLLAGLGIRRACSYFNLSPTIAWTGATIYALSCPVIFQINNLIYLVSAAWVGFCLLELICLATLESPGWLQRLCNLFLFSALMFLGGDPHTCINTWILFCLAVLFRIFTIQRKAILPLPTFSHRFLPLRWKFALLSLALIAGTLQAIPTWRWAQHCRLAATEPITLPPELANLPLEQVNLRHPIYDFSISPLDLGTLACATLTGHFQPTATRWSAALESEGRMWTPSLYFGCLPFWILVVSFPKLLPQRSTRFLVCVAVFGGLAAMGNYSPMWFLRQLFLALGWQTDYFPIDSWSSLYGLLTNLPGYAWFRFPAKWSVWISASCAILVAHQLAAGVQHISCARWKLFAAGCSYIFLGSITYCSSQLTNATWKTDVQTWLDSRSDAWLGSAQIDASLMSMTFGLIIGGSVCLVAASMLAAGKTNRFVHAVALLTLVELTTLGLQWADFTPAPQLDSAWPRGRPTLVRLWANMNSARIQQDRNIDARIKSEQNFDTVKEQTSYQLTFAAGKLIEIGDIGGLHSSQSLDPLGVRKLKAWLNAQDQLTPDQPELDQVLAELGISHRLVRQNAGENLQQFSWQKIPGTKLLCEFLANEPQRYSNPVSQLVWRWSSGKLLVDINARTPGTLRIRQFSDGGWQVADWNGSVTQPLKNRLFIEVPIEPGERTLSVERKWLW
ncbi:MAG: hypothetical protein KDB03_11995 [Planctomycetales bacterium]|nr:hypothetical protein [Planctomycetales bacterium]